MEFHDIFILLFQTSNSIGHYTLITLLRIPYFGRIGSTKLVLPKWHKYGTPNRVIRVKFCTILGKSKSTFGSNDLIKTQFSPILTERQDALGDAFGGLMAYLAGLLSLASK